MKKDTTSKGDLAEMEIVAALMREGKKVLRPISAGLRYDLVIDNQDGSFARVQCKTGVVKAGAIGFRVSNSDGRRPMGVSYRGQVDAFAVYCPHDRSVYLVPMEAVADCEKAAVLRLEPPKNGQFRRIRYARDYEIGSTPTAERPRLGL